MRLAQDVSQLGGAFFVDGVAVQPQDLEGCVAGQAGGQGGRAVVMQRVAVEQQHAQARVRAHRRANELAAALMDAVGAQVEKLELLQRRAQRGGNGARARLAAAHRAQVQHHQ